MYHVVFKGLTCGCFCIYALLFPPRHWYECTRPLPTEVSPLVSWPLESAAKEKNTLPLHPFTCKAHTLPASTRTFSKHPNVHIAVSAPSGTAATAKDTMRLACCKSTLQVRAAASRGLIIRSQLLLARRPSVKGCGKYTHAGSVPRQGARCTTTPASEIPATLDRGDVPPKMSSGASQCAGVTGCDRSASIATSRCCKGPGEWRWWSVGAPHVRTFTLGKSSRQARPAEHLSGACKLTRVAVNTPRAPYPKAPLPMSCGEI